MPLDSSELFLGDQQARPDPTFALISTMPALHVNRSSSRLDGLARFSEVARPQPSLPATAVSEKSM
jgi:hypothetical protein